KKNDKKRPFLNRFFNPKIGFKYMFLKGFFIEKNLNFGAKSCDLFLYNQAGGVASLNPQNQGQGRTLNGFNPPNPRNGGEGQGQRQQLPPQKRMLKNSPETLCNAF
ncbi:hypothetical protein RE131_005997, partial [Klebsiella variicola]|nr:hypothetical protein [Klebsiella variicola]